MTCNCRITTIDTHSLMRQNGNTQSKYTNPVDGVIQNIIFQYFPLLSAIDD